jgi:hypothetical protein
MHQTYYFCSLLKAPGHSYSSAFVLDRFKFSQHISVLNTFEYRMKRGLVFALSFFIV